MNGTWPLMPLGDVLKKRQEVPDDEKISRGDIPIISKIGFNDGKIELRKEGGSKTNMILVRPGDLLVSGINAAKGAIAIYDTKDGRPAAATIHYSAYEVVKDKADIQYLWWYLRSASFREVLLCAVPGGIKSELKPGRLLPIIIPMPPIDEQRRIVARIDELSRMIYAAKTLRTETMSMSETLFSALLTRVFSKNRLDMALERVCSDIVDNLHSTPRYDGDEYPCIRSQDVGFCSINLRSAMRTSKVEFEERTRRGEPQKGDIVFVREGGGMGKCAVVKADDRFSLGQRVMMFRPNQDLIIPDFLLYQLMSRHVLDEQIIDSQSGSASPHINISHLKRVRICCPSLDDQLTQLSQLNGMKAKIDEIHQLQLASSYEEEALMPSILDKAFKGEL